MIATIRFQLFAAIALISTGAVNGATYRVQLLDPPGAVGGFAFDINDSGVVVGEVRSSDARSGLVWEPSGIYHVVPSRELRGGLTLRGINSLGSTVGKDYGEQVWQEEVIVREVDGQIHYMELPSDFYSPSFDDIDDFGKTIGNFQQPGGEWSSFIWAPGEAPRVLYDLPDPPSGCHPFNCVTGVRRINNEDWILGSITDDNLDHHGFLYRLSDGFTERIDYPDARSTSLRGMNDYGDIVGSAVMPSGPGIDFLRHADGTYELLAFPDFWQFSLQGINNHGDLVGDYRMSADGPRRPFVAWSVPEPSALALVVTGLASLAIALRFTGSSVKK